jgi:hypothetical protein
MAPRLQFPQINGETNMQDAVFILVTIGFFAAAMAYVWGCDRLK